MTDREDAPATGGASDRERSLDDATAESVLEDAFEGDGTAPLGGDQDDAGTPADRDDERTTTDPERRSRPSPGSEPAPEEAISRPLDDRRELDRAGRVALRETYGYVRAYFKARPERYRDLQRWLKQARIRGTYDTYLTESARRAAIAGIVGWLVGIALAVVLAATEVPVARTALTLPLPWGGRRGGATSHTRCS